MAHVGSPIEGVVQNVELEPTEDYVRRHSGASILRSAMQIYARHFGLLWCAGILPMLPGAVIVLLRWNAQPAGWTPLLDLALSLVNLVPYTVLISDICVGNRPSLRRAYRHAFGKLTGTALLSATLVFLIVMAGLLLLIIPGIIFAQWYWFVGPVVALERTTARGALTRSRELGKGSYLRNLGIMLLTFAVVAAPVCVLGVVWALWELPVPLNDAVATLLGALASPPISIAIVLLYYDLRVRTEAYDSTKLAEDLRR